MKLKKILAGFLAAAVTVAAFFELRTENTVYAENGKYEPPAAMTAGGNTEISGANSFGNMVAKELSEASAEQEENNGYNIFSVEIEQNRAKVTFEALQDCIVAVAVYDNENAAMIGSGFAKAAKEKTEAEIKIDAALPEYFYIRAYLVNSNTLRPLSTEYGSPMYTREMQEFLSKTAEDFDQERVLNLDDDINTNFAVFGKDTVLISDSGDRNVLVSADESTLTYVFGNPDESLTALKAGDVFAYDNEGELIILKAASVSTDKKSGNVTVVGEEVELEEVFEHLRIDGESRTEDAAVDNSNLEDGVTFEGLVRDEDGSSDNNDSEIAAQAIDIGGKTGFSFKYKVEDSKKTGGSKFTLSAGLEFKLEASAKIYVSFKEIYVQLKLDYSTKVFAEIEGEISKDFPLSYFAISPVSGVYISFTPSFIIEFDGEATIDGRLYGMIGFKASTKGMENLTSTPKFSLNGEIKVNVFLGLSLEPEISIISEKIASAKITAKVGAEIKAVLKKSTDKDEKKRHDCDACFDGDINAKLDFSASIKLLNKDKWTFKATNELSVHLLDFYVSLTYREFGLRECPHHSYLAEITVKNRDSEKLQGVEILVDEAAKYNTDYNGKVQIWLTEGKHSLKFTAEGYRIKNSSYKVKTRNNKISATLYKENEPTPESVFKSLLDLLPGGSSNPGDLDYDEGWNSGIKQVSLGDDRSAAITNDGSLYVWGYDTHRWYDNGTFEPKSSPIKIMDNVSSVSLGYGGHSAAITDDGSLYMWGSNGNGQLGDGTTESRSTPIKIMDNVSSVSLGCNYSAAITDDGSLYMWGSNSYGQLGDGTTKSKSTPIKIMDNVSSVSLGGYHSAAITDDGSLYMWGSNTSGRLGDGTTKSKSTPIKIMDNVSSVSLGYLHSAAITEDGSLYVWGSNSSGQLGDGTTEIKRTPIKIMDNVSSVSLGEDHSAAITDDGSLYMWGGNAFGQLGNEGYEDKYTPIKIMDNVSSVSLGEDHSAAITVDGSLCIWGYNGYGQLDGITYENIKTPIKIMNNVSFVNLGEDHSAAITDNGSLYIWGVNSAGQLGDGTTEDKSTPIKIMDNVSSVSLGNYHSAAITEDGSLYMWGYNGSGQLGDGTTESKRTPIKIMDNVSSVSLGHSYSAAITDDGSLYMWGWNGYGQLGDGTQGMHKTPIKIMDNVSSVSLGYGRSAAITYDGSLYMWGDNEYGQLGDGTRKDKSTPIKIMDDVSSVSLGDRHSAAITYDGSLFTWGDDVCGQLGNGTGGDEHTPVKIMDNVSSVSLGEDHSAAITYDGGLYMWGDNDYGQLGNGTKGIKQTPIKIMDNASSVNMGGSHSAAITDDGSLYVWGSSRFGQVGNGTYEYKSTPIKITLPTEDSSNPHSSNTPITCRSLPASTKTLTSLLPNEIYNIYSVNSRTADNILSADNLLYIGQARSDENGTLTIPAEAQKGTVFVKAMKEFDVYNAPITSAKVSGSSVTLEWEAVEGASEYEVYCYTTDGIYSQTKTASNTLTVNHLEKGKYYGFLVVSTVYGEQSVPAIGDTILIKTEAVQLGEINGDGKISAVDAKWVLQSVSGSRTLTPEQMAAADVNGDGKVTAVDAKWILQSVSGSRVLE